MSLLPWGFGGNPFGGYGGSFGGGFGGGLESWDPFTDATFGNMLAPMDVFEPRGRRRWNQPMNWLNQQLAKTNVKEDDKSFQVLMDVSHFSPNEVTVKTTEKDVIIHGKHEEKSDRHGYVSREFRRRYTLPQGVNPESVTCTLSPEGVLTVLAPKMAIEGKSERVIPITPAPAAGALGPSTPGQGGQQQTQQQQQQPQTGGAA